VLGALLVAASLFKPRRSHNGTIRWSCFHLRSWPARLLRAASAGTQPGGGELPLAVQRRLAAAALREALVPGAKAARLELALDRARPLVGLDPSLLQRAETALEQRRRQEQQQLMQRRQSSSRKLGATPEKISRQSSGENAKATQQQQQQQQQVSSLAFAEPSPAAAAEVPEPPTTLVKGDPGSCSSGSRRPLSQPGSEPGSPRSSGSSSPAPTPLAHSPRTPASQPQKRAQKQRRRSGDDSGAEDAPPPLVAATPPARSTASKHTPVAGAPGTPPGPSPPPPSTPAASRQPAPLPKEATPVVMRRRTSQPAAPSPPAAAPTAPAPVASRVALQPSADQSLLSKAGPIKTKAASGVLTARQQPESSSVTPAKQQQAPARSPGVAAPPASRTKQQTSAAVATLQTRSTAPCSAAGPLSRPSLGATDPEVQPPVVSALSHRDSHGCWHSLDSTSLQRPRQPGTQPAGFTQPPPPPPPPRSSGGGSSVAATAPVKFQPAAAAFPAHSACAIPDQQEVLLEQWAQRGLEQQEQLQRQLQQRQLLANYLANMSTLEPPAPVHQYQQAAPLMPSLPMFNPFSGPVGAAYATAAAASPAFQPLPSLYQQTQQLLQQQAQQVLQQGSPSAYAFGGAFRATDYEAPQLQQQQQQQLFLGGAQQGEGEAASRWLCKSDPPTASPSAAVSSSQQVPVAPSPVPLFSGSSVWSPSATAASSNASWGALGQSGSAPPFFGRPRVQQQQVAGDAALMLSMQGFSLVAGDAVVNHQQPGHHEALQPGSVISPCHLSSQG
jgi:hypothetical protein